MFEGGDEHALVKRAAAIRRGGSQFITLLALTDEGSPIFDKELASKLASVDIPSFACTPDLFPSLMAAAIKKEDIQQWVARSVIAQ